MHFLQSRDPAEYHLYLPSSLPSVSMTKPYCDTAPVRAFRKVKSVQRHALYPAEKESWLPGNFLRQVKAMILRTAEVFAQKSSWVQGYLRVLAIRNLFPAGGIASSGLSKPLLARAIFARSHRGLFLRGQAVLKSRR